MNQTKNIRMTTIIDSDDDFCSVCRNVSHHYRLQSFSGLHSPGRSNCLCSIAIIRYIFVCINNLVVGIKWLFFPNFLECWWEEDCQRSHYLAIPVSRMSEQKGNVGKLNRPTRLPRCLQPAEII